MRSVSFQFYPISRIGSAPNLIKIVIPVLLLALAFYEFSAQLWILLGLVALFALAIVSRIGHLSVTPDHNVASGSYSCADGGTFRKNTTPQQSANARPVVHDGGSFERSKTS